MEGRRKREMNKKKKEQGGSFFELNKRMAKGMSCWGKKE